MNEPTTTQIQWRLHLRSAPDEVYELLATDQGRAKFWAESAIETDGVIEFVFPGGKTRWLGRVLAADAPNLFQVEYQGGTITTFKLKPDTSGGTELTLTDEGVADDKRTEVSAGWVSVLLTLKAVADFDIDLRNHDPTRTWWQGYVDN